MECCVKGISVYYEVIGHGKPLLMIHGFYPDHRLMKGCMEPIFEGDSGYKRIYFDLPGMGKTKAESWISNSDVMLDIVLAFIDQVIPGENFLLAGESYGGYLSRGIIARIPERVDGLLMICPLIIPDASKRKLPEKQVILRNAALLSGLDAEAAEKYSSISVVQSEETWHRFRDGVLPGLRLADTEFLESLRSSGYGFSFDIEKHDRRFDKPALMLLGRQDSGVGYKDAWDILDNYPRATFAVLDRAGHCLESEQHEIFNCMVSEWLHRVEEYLQQEKGAAV